MNNDYLNILGILILPLALMIIVLIYIAAQVKYDITGKLQEIKNIIER